MLKYRTRRDHQTSLARSAHKLNRDDAVAPKCKEVVLNPNPLDPQNLRKQPAQQLLLRRARKTPTPARNSGAGSAPRSSFPFAVSGKLSKTTIAAGTM